MRRMLIMLAIALTATLSYGLYEMSYSVQALRKAHNTLASQITKERETNALLRAEWAYRNRPDNLQLLAADHLGLAPIAPDQVVATIEEIPIRGALQADGTVPVPRRRPASVKVRR